ITGEQGRVPIRACFEGRQKRCRLLLAALVRQMGHDAEMTRQGERTPNPGVTPVGGGTWLQMRLFFLTKLQRSSTCTCVGCTSRMKWRWTAAPCCPARSNQWSTASALQCLIRLTARRLLRSTSMATASRCLFRKSCASRFEPPKCVKWSIRSRHVAMFLPYDKDLDHARTYRAPGIPDS